MTQLIYIVMFTAFAAANLFVSTRCLVYKNREGRMLGYALSHRFCESCSRVRLTSEGLLKPCLQYAEGVGLRSLLRSGADDDTLTKSIRTGIFRKPRQHGFCVETAECGDPGTGGEPAEVRQKEEGLMSGIGG